jgi:hypothetical protein
MKKDKLLPFIAGFAASLAGAVCWFLSGSPLVVLPWFAFLASCVAGLTKEAADWINNRKRPALRHQNCLSGCDYLHLKQI